MPVCGSWAKIPMGPLKPNAPDVDALRAMWLMQVPKWQLRSAMIIPMRQGVPVHVLKFRTHSAASARSFQQN